MFDTKRENRIHDSQDDSFFEIESTDGVPIGFITPSSIVKRPSARFKEDESLVEITLDIPDDSVSIQGVKDADSETKDLASQLGKRVSSLGSQLSSRLHHISQELKRLATSKSYSKVDRNKSSAAKALKGLRFISKDVCNQGWSKVEAKFDELAVDGLLPRLHFGQCIGMIGSDEFAGHLFDVFALRKGVTSSSMTKDQFQVLWKQLADKSFDSRIQTFFAMVDKDGDGKITKEEIIEIITLSAAANKLTKVLSRVDEYAAQIMEALDPDKVGYIELYSLERLLLHIPDQLTRSTINNQNLNQILSQELVPTREPSLIKRWYKKVIHFTEDNWKQIWVATLWVLITVGLFMWKFIEFKNKPVLFNVLGYCVATAKGGAEILKFNMALILFPVCRNTITWLRNKTKLGVVIPIDDNINFHKLIAVGIVIGIGLHAGAHTSCNLPRILHATDEEYAPISPYFGEERPPNYWWFLKGTEGWTGVTMILLMVIAYTLALPWFRRNKLKLPKALEKFVGFDAFWYSHHLFVIVYALYIVHGVSLYLTDIWHEKTTWMYLAIPITLYACERLIRVFRSKFKTVNILEFAVHPGDVLELRMSKPHGFTYRSGQYVFVKCRSISPFQWHPFSITSSPGEDYLSVHIRAAGNWTKQLKELFSKVSQPASADQRNQLRSEMIQANNIQGLPRISIDGPFGAPSQDYKEYDVLLLVGLGIGATPLISIVKDVLHNIKQQNEIKELEVESGTNNNKRKLYAVSRAYFYWVTRGEGSYEWFKGVMNQVTEQDHDKVIDLHNYCSTVYEQDDARSALIAMLQSLHHAKSGVDIVSETNVKTQFGRPDWRSVFKNITINHPNQRVGVFYCGAPLLVKKLRQLSHEFSRITTTKFDFHKENF